MDISLEKLLIDMGPAISSQGWWGLSPHSGMDTKPSWFTEEMGPIA